MRQEFINEIIANGKYINDEIFWNYFKLKAKNERLVNNVNDGLNDLRKVVIRKEILENENPNKIIDIVEKIRDFNKQQKGKGIKILTPKQMLQRLQITVEQVKAGNTSENLNIFSVSRERDY